jgi:hypothetical protein
MISVCCYLTSEPLNAEPLNRVIDIWGPFLYKRTLAAEVLPFVARMVFKKGIENE